MLLIQNSMMPIKSQKSLILALNSHAEYDSYSEQGVDE